MDQHIPQTNNNSKQELEAKEAGEWAQVKQEKEAMALMMMSQVLIVPPRRKRASPSLPLGTTSRLSVFLDGHSKPIQFPGCDSWIEIKDKRYIFIIT